MPKLAIDPSDKEDSLIKDVRTPKLAVVTKMQSSIIALGIRAQKFGKKVLPSEQLLRNMWPPTKNTWKVFSNTDSCIYLQSAANINQYKTTYYYFYSRLAFVAYGFSVDELQAIFKATMLNFIHERSNID